MEHIINSYRGMESYENIYIKIRINYPIQESGHRKLLMK